MEAWCGRYEQTFSRRAIIAVAALALAASGYLVLAAARPGAVDATDLSGPATTCDVLALMSLVSMSLVHPFTEITSEGVRVRRSFIARTYRWQSIRRFRVAAPAAPLSRIVLGPLRTRPLPGLPPDVALQLDAWFRHPRDEES